MYFTSSSSCHQSSRRPVILVAILSLLATSTHSFHHGGPAYSCKNLLPGHIKSGIQTENSPYMVEVASRQVVPGQPITVRLSSSPEMGIPFKGFICAVSELDDRSNSTVGEWGVLNENSDKTLDCYGSDPRTAVTHRDATEQMETEFFWTPPTSASKGNKYKLRCSAVQSFSLCWVDMMIPLEVVDQLPAQPPTQPNGGAGTGRPTTGTPSTGQGQGSQGRPSTPASGTGTTNPNNNNNNGGSRPGGVSDPVGGPMTGPGNLPNPQPPQNFPPVFLPPPGPQSPFSGGQNPRFPNRNSGNTFPDVSDPFDFNSQLEFDLGGPLNLQAGFDLGSNIPLNLPNGPGPFGGNLGQNRNGGVQTGPGPVVDRPTGLGQNRNNNNRRLGNNNNQRNAGNNNDGSRIVNNTPRTGGSGLSNRLFGDSGSLADGNNMVESQNTLRDFGFPRSRFIDLILNSRGIRFPTLNQGLFNSRN